jgi:hypothetical protein
MIMAGDNLGSQDRSAAVAYALPAVSAGESASGCSNRVRSSRLGLIWETGLWLVGQAGPERPRPGRFRVGP